MRSTAPQPLSRVPRGRTERGRYISGFLVTVMVVAAMALGSAAGTGLAQAQTNPSTDRAALVALYNATDGPNWANNTNWLSNEPIGEWHGVTVDSGGNVTRLDLGDNRLTGTIPEELGNLSSLTYLDLLGNQLTGEIPSDLGSLSNLEGLHVSENQLTGPIPPGLGGLSNLQRLYLNDNSGLSGPLPGSFTGLTSLTYLDLSGTGVCAPTDASFQAWLENIATRHGVVNCREQTTGDPLIDRYDTNNNATIEKSEVIAAIRDYFMGRITKAQTIAVIRLYFSAPRVGKPGVPKGLTAAGNGQTRIDLSWSAPPSDGGAAITGYRIEVSEDGSTWTDLVANTGNAATSYSHTGLTAGTTRHYRVSAINSAGTGPASNIATGNTDTSSGNQAPDLAVGTPSVDDSSPTTGASFTLSATVGNQGDGPSASTTLRYYRSTNSSISSSDTAVGTDSVGGLAALGTSVESTSVTAPSTAGTYYYGACVDSVSGESDTTNNCSVSVAVAVSAAPDLVVGAPTVSDSSPTAGASFTLSATVRNRGSGSSAATTLRYYQSTDATITTSDTEVGTDSVSGLLRDGDSSAEDISLTAPSSAGAYYYGACVDSVTGESNTGNNCSSGVAVAVGTPPAPDLVVDTPSVDDSSPTTGESFTLSATVRNQGSGSSGSTTLRYYRSTDSTISSSDTQVGTDSVSGLAVSASGDESISLTAPSTSGTYYYGACVDSVSGESNTTNNCSSGVGVIVSAAPDLVVDAPSVDDSSPTAGESFTLSATVRNRGSGSSAATTLRYYQSTDATITTSDTEVGTDSVSGLLRDGDSSAEDISLTAPSSAGAYYYGACVDSVSGESNTGNNCSSGVAVAVGTPPAPDLVVDTPSVDDSSPTTGESFTLSATVRNQGSGSSGSTTLRYYRSTDSTISSSDTAVGTDSVGGLSASGHSAQSISLTAPSTAGTYYYGACVDSVTDESDTTNNCSSAVTVTVGAAPAPDLVVDTPTVTKSAPTAGASFTLNATVRNQGNGSSGSTTLRYYQSTDSTITTGDTSVGTDFVSGLSASGSGDESITLTAPSTADTYYYGACVDSVTGESVTDNNCSSGVAVAVGTPPAPDLVVGSPSVDDSSPTTGASFTLSATVGNRGSGSSAATTLRYYRSADSSISSSDTAVGTDSVSGLSASGTSAESIPLTAPSSAGTYYYGACVDSVSGESDTTNNCSVSVAVAVSAAPDLVVDAPTVSDSSPTAGASFTLSATVRNRGGGSSAATTLRYYQSTDATITTSDTEVGTDSVSGLLRDGDSSAEDISLTAPSSAGAYYYGACVDSVSGESNTGNNCSSGVAVAVGTPPAPDLVVDTPSVDDSSPTTGESFTLSATVRNQGSGSSGSTTLRYYRSTDSTISSSDTAVGTDSVGGLSASGHSAQSISLTAPSTSGTYYYGACVDSVTDESNTTNNCSSGVGVIVSAAPDLVVDAPSVDDSSPTAGESFTLSATVRNRGDGPSDSTTLRYYLSTDSTISSADTPVGTDSVGGLPASGSSDETITLTAPDTPGTYHYGACVDAATGETNPGNNCSTAVAVAVGAAPAPAGDYDTDNDGLIEISNLSQLNAVRWDPDGNGAVSNRAEYYDAFPGAENGTGCPNTGCTGYELVSDLDFDTNANGQADAGDAFWNGGAGWEPMELGSTFGGGGHTIANLYINRANEDDVGLFGASSAGRIQGVGLVSANVTGGKYVGGLVGYNSGSTISDSYATGSVTGTGDRVGGLIGYSFVGTITASYATGSVSGANYVGGLVGYGSRGAITGSYATGSVTGTGDRVGGLIGYSFVGTITANYATGSVSGAKYVGGLVGYGSRGAITGSYATGSVTGTGDRVGGLIGYRFRNTITTSYATGSVSGANYVGGLVGYGSRGAITGSYAIGSVSGANYVGGLVGYGLDATVSVSYWDTQTTGQSSSDGGIGKTTVELRSPTGYTGIFATWNMDLDDDGSTDDPWDFGTSTQYPVLKYQNLSSERQQPVGTPLAPDLVVGAPTVSDSSPTAGASFTLSATVRNRGSGSSAATTLRYYQSTDATITTSDTEVGTDSVSGLLRDGDSSAEDISLTAPSSAGAYYYGACVDSVSGESNTGNNCSSGVAVAVGTPPAPDLVVDTPSVDDSSPTTGESFTLSATVRNQGSGSSGSTTLRYYRSTDSTISSSDTAVGTDSVGGLSASGHSAQSISLTAPSTAGTYYYGACVDSVTDESDTTNNCSSAVTVTVGAAPAPDLVVDTPTVTKSAPTAGASFTLNATVRNQGNGSSGSTTLRYYQSTDSTITTGDTSVGTDFVSGLSASGSGDESITLTAPSTAGTYYYGACVDSVTGESVTDNNCSSGVAVAVGTPPAPDLVVGSPSVDDSSPTTGESFTLSATVGNRGSGSSAATTLRYYRSADSSISSSDTAVGTDSVSGLSASGTSPESISVTAPSSAGTYYYGACVDSVSGESDTTNNCSSGIAVTVSAAPDLVVGAPTVSDNSPTTGESFTLSATVRNRGNSSSAATTLRYYRSADSSISSSDTAVGTDSVGGLSASGTSPESISVTAPSSAGTYYYGACVDSVSGESNTGNNCSSGVAVAVGTPPAPDLVVGSPSVDDSSPTTGASFTLSATVRNRGNGSSAATTLRYYRSADSSISSSDTAVGTDSVGGLSASGTSPESISVTAPSSAGTYYYGACVDSVSGESNTSNNCSSGVAVAVGTPPAPDLVVGSPSVDDSSPTTGASFTLSATVRNQGSGSSAATTLRYYRSADSSISSSDTAVGTDSVGGLSASGTSAESISVTAPSTAGTYYYGACVDSVSGESNTGNNCSSGVAVAVGTPPAPDLVVGSPSVDDSSPTTGASFTLSATVGNRGSGSSAATTLRYYRSADSSISSSDTAVGTDSVSGLSASGTSPESISVTAPSSAGTYYYGACVDSVSGESDTSNNCSSGIAVTVSAAPDLVVGAPTVSDSSPTTGESFTLSATVRNQGSGSSAATTLRYYRSADSSISSSDTAVGTDSVGGLSASGTSPESISVTAPSSAGTYYYGACVDSVSGESSTSNNCSSGIAVTVSAAPDLVVDTPSVSDSSPTAGASFTLSATVRNQGSGSSGPTTLRYYRSTDSTISSSDTSAGTDAVGGLSASGTSAESISVTAPSSAGTYYYGACVDSVSGESNTGNNCSSGVAVTVGVATAPDLVVGSPSVSDSSPTTGASFTLSATVRNQGSGSSGSTRLRYYRSADSTISSSDAQVGTDAVSGLAASASGDESIRLTAPSTAGTYYYGACVDSVTGESVTDNNCSSGIAVTVSAAPDLVVDTPSVSDSSPTAGASFTLSATVRNQGSGSSGPTTLRYYRSTDSTISSSDTSAGTDAVGGLSASGTSAESISVTAPSSAGTYYYGACVDSVSGESNTGNNCSSGVDVTVVSAIPDLAIETPTVSDSSPPTGESFTLSVTVRNQGNVRSALTTLRYYRSTDSTISSSDTSAGTDLVSGLSASGTSAESIRLTAPSTAGTYYYGACVDSVSGESDTTNNCSSGVAVTVVSAIPDLAIETPTVSDSSPHIGESFTLSVTVINQGNVRSDFTELRFYRSKDSTISSSDTQVARRNQPWLSPAESEATSIILTAPSSEGTYYFGACVDAVSGETDTANNCSAAVTVVVVTPSSDLVVEVPTFSNSSPPAGTSFTLTATVRNQGIEPSSSRTTLRYYRSDDSTITASDTPVGTDSVGTLAASGSSDGAISLTAPTTPGTYYYGACVDTISGESDASNNCSLAVTLNVVAAIPDLVAETPTVSESRPELGDSFTLSVTVRNQGNVRSARTTLRYYRSTDSTITTADTSVGTDSVSRLNVSAISTESTDLDTPSTLGTYYYGACVDTVSGESDTSNNCSDAVEVVVVVPSGPDLAVEMPTVSKDTLEPGESFTLSVTVRNTGSAGSGSTTLRYSTVLGTEVGTSALESLVASAIGTASITLTAPSTEGSIYYKVCVDPVPGETNTGNNCSGLVWITVPDSIEYELTECTITPGPDFDITIHVSLTAIRAVESVTIKGYVLNHGIGESVEIGRKTIRNMAAGETVNTTVTGSVSEHYFQCAIKVDWD